MCTVSYIPYNKGFYFTTNRDESPLRKTLAPQQVPLANDEVLIAPIDAAHGGSWIATNQKGKVACLLNGGFVKHRRKLPYRESRGHYVFEAFKSSSFSNFVEEVNLENIEPFTMILVDEELQVLVWDGEKKHLQVLDKDMAHLWSSSTLYGETQHQEKLKTFNSFLKVEDIDAEAILRLHGLYQKNNFILELPNVKTVSITQVVKNMGSTQLRYHSKNKKDEQINVFH